MLLKKNAFYQFRIRIKLVEDCRETFHTGSRVDVVVVNIEIRMNLCEGMKNHRLHATLHNLRIMSFISPN